MTVDRVEEWDLQVARIVPSSKLSISLLHVSFPEPRRIGRIQDCIRTGCVAPADIFVDFPGDRKSKVVVDFRSNQPIGRAIESMYHKGDDVPDDDSEAETDSDSEFEAPVSPHSHLNQPQTETLDEKLPEPSTETRRTGRAGPSASSRSLIAPPLQSRTSSTSSYKTAASFAFPESKDDDESSDERSHADSDADEYSPAVSDNDSEYIPSSGPKASRSRKRARDGDDSDVEGVGEPAEEVVSDEEAPEEAPTTTSRGQRVAKRQKTDDAKTEDVIPRVREFLFPKPLNSFVCLEPGCGHRFKVTYENDEPTIPNADITNHYLTHFVACKVWDEKEKKMVDKLRCGLTMMQAARVEQTHDDVDGHKATITVFSYESPCDAHYKNNAAANKSIYRHVQGKHLLTQMRECQQCFTAFPQSRSDSAGRHAKDNCHESLQGGVSPEYEVIDIGVAAAPTKKVKADKAKAAPKGVRKHSVVAPTKTAKKTTGERRKSERKRAGRG